MNKVGTVILIIILVGVIAYLIYKTRVVKEETKRKLTVATIETNASAFDAVNNFFNGTDIDSTNVEEETMTFGRRFN